MITGPVDDLFQSWLASQLPGVGVASERPEKLESRLPFVVIRRGSSGKFHRELDNPRIDCDFYAATRLAAENLGRQVQTLFEYATPVGWRGAQLSWLRCIENVRKVPDSNQAVRHCASTNSFSLR